MTQSADQASDQDMKKGAVEDGPNTLGNANAEDALDDSGLPSDEEHSARVTAHLQPGLRRLCTSQRQQRGSAGRQPGQL